MTTSNVLGETPVRSRSDREGTRGDPAPPASHPIRSRAAAFEPLVLHHELRDFTRFPIAPLLAQGRPDVYEQCTSTIARAREYTERHLVGHVEAWDEEAGRDHRVVPWAAVDAALPYGFLSMNIPRIFGGGNMGACASALFAEEIASVDAGMFVVFGAHGLALALGLSSLDTRIVSKLAREICDGEQNGKAVLLALAHTEPGGGSDVEDVHDIQRASIASRFSKVPGGYRVNGRKVFISNGSIARYNVLTACADPSRPLETMAGFVIPHDAPGFSVGRVEHKMGQRLSTAAEVLCDDVFVPDESAVMLPDPGRVIDTTLSLTRGPVGAMSAGIIRGTIERTLAYLAQKRLRGRWLFEEQWVTLALADMMGALQAARGLYMDASLAGDEWGIASFMKGMPRWLPSFVVDSRAMAAVVTHPRVVERSRAMYKARVPDETLQRLVAHASIAKFVCSDLAVHTSMKAMEVLGEDANDPTWGVEKCMRDAKLAQIFEGTNQINRLHVTRGLVKSS
jgi:alkylation response protein AidB-like acyl-CoA dehydrogenase